MADAQRTGPPIGTAILLVLAFVLYAGMMGSLSDAPNSDAMGRGIALAFGAILSTALCIVLAVLLLVAAIQGSMSIWGKIGAFILLPLATVAMWIADDAYGHRDYSAIWVPALLPPLFLLYALRARFAPLRQKIGEGLANIVVGVAVLVLAGVPLVRAAMPTPRDPAAEARAMEQEKERIAREEQAAREKRQQDEAAFAALGLDSSMSDYFVYLHDARFTKQALAGIQQVKNRQAESIALLQQKPLTDLTSLWEFGLEPTPELCRAYGDALAGAASNVTKKQSNYLGAAIDLEWQLPNIQWLVAAHCDLDRPLSLLEANLRAVADSSRITGFADTLAGFHQTK